MTIVVIFLIVFMISLANEMEKFYEKGQLDKSTISSHTTFITIVGIISIIILVIDFIKGLIA